MVTELVVQNVIIGAGAAGIQLAYNFEKAGVPYILLERGELPGYRYHKYPHSGKLLSVNKKNTGSTNPEYNLRHDWHSLLTEEGYLFPGTNYYPDKAEMVNYLHSIVNQCKLKIAVKCEVKRVKKMQDCYILQAVQQGKEIQFRAEKVIVATGFSEMVYPYVENHTKEAPKHYGEFEPDAFRKPEVLEKYRNKSVYLIGNGNAAHELACMLMTVASKILIHGRAPRIWSSISHCPDDLRSMYLSILDPANMGGQIAIHNSFNQERFIITQKKKGDPYLVQTKCLQQGCNAFHEPAKGPWDHVIFCTGWRIDLSMFDFQIDITHANSMPLLTPNYESENNKGLFFIGKAMHIHDYKKSAGSHLYGFRYLIQHFFRVNYTNRLNVQVFQKDKLQDLVSHMHTKVNLSSALYAMHGHIVDVMFWNASNQNIMYFNDIPLPYAQVLQEKYKPEKLLTLSLQYGDQHTTDIRELLTKQGSLGYECNSIKIHPVVNLFAMSGPLDQIHFQDAPFAEFPTFQERCMRIMKGLLAPELPKSVTIDTIQHGGT